MREFLLREFDALSELWQGYAEDLTGMLDRRSLERRSEIEKHLATVVNIMDDLDKLLGLEDENNLDRERLARARQLLENYQALHTNLAGKRSTCCANA